MLSTRNSPSRFVPILAVSCLCGCFDDRSASDASTDPLPFSDNITFVDDSPPADDQSEPPPDVPPPDPPCVDNDRDSHPAAACGGDDCDDNNRRIYPGAPEVCDPGGVDEDCDPCTVAGSSVTPDDGGSVHQNGDEDGDSFISAGCINTYLGPTPTACKSSVRVDPSMLRVTGRDCNDSSSDVHPNQSEACNGRDDNCNGEIDEGVKSTFYLDRDGDGFGDQATPELARPACNRPTGFSATSDDCNDSDAAIHPGAREVCDREMPPVDENCNGTRNEGCDCGDGDDRPCMLPGACAAGRQRCVVGHWGNCSISPIAETCDGIDNDCDGMADEGLLVDCYRDVDGDGFASANTPLERRCFPATAGVCPPGYGRRPPTSGAIDCNDSVAAIRPDAIETCNGVDDDCDGAVDEDQTRACYEGPSGTAGRGVCRQGMQTCSGGRLSTCVGQVLPTPEVCDGVDDDCNGQTDVGCPINITRVGITSSTAVGGPGGGPFYLPCPSGQVVIGFYGRSGDWIDAIQPVCSSISFQTLPPSPAYSYRINIAGESFSGHTTTLALTLRAPPGSTTLAYQGGPGGGPWTAICPLGTAVQSVRLRSWGGLLGELSWDCGALIVQADRSLLQNFAVSAPTYGLPRGSAQDVYACTNGFVVGVFGRSGASIDQLGVTCGEFSLVRRLPP